MLEPRENPCYKIYHVYEELTIKTKFFSLVITKNQLHLFLNFEEQKSLFMFQTFPLLPYKMSDDVVHMHIYIVP